MNEVETSKGPLAGVVIADMSRVLAGPYATMLLADMGATVIKIESPDGDETRTWLPPVRDERSTYFMSVNRNKRSIALDLKSDADLAVMDEILQRADVFVENFKPGGLAKFGLDAESTATKYPRLIHASITGFGAHAPATMPGYDVLIQAASGLMSVTGEPDGQPQKTGVALVDVLTGMHLAIGILGALRQRDAESGGHGSDGQVSGGQHVGVNLLSSALSGLVNQASAWVAGDVRPRRMGNDHPSLFPYGPFAAADREVVVACGNDGQYARLMRLLGAEEFIADERFATMSARNGHREELRAIIEERLATDDAEAWLAKMREAGIPASLILDVAEGFEFADSLGLAPVRDVAGIPVVAHPVSYSQYEPDYRLAPPDLNADAEWVRDWLAEG